MVDLGKYSQLYMPTYDKQPPLIIMGCYYYIMIQERSSETDEGSDITTTGTTCYKVSVPYMHVAQSQLAESYL